MSRILLRDLQPGSNYKIQVRATDGTNVSEWSPLFDLATSGDTLAPASPSNLVWTVEGTAFKATWKAPTTNADAGPLKDLRDYQITVFSPAAPTTKAVFYTSALRWDFPFESNVNALGTARSSVTVEVRARDHSGNLSEPVTATATNPAPSNVTGLTVSGLQDAISVRWNPISDSDLKQYEVHMSQAASNFTADATTLRYAGAGTSFILDTFNTSVWYVKVRAIDVFGTASAVDATGSASARSSLTVDNQPPAPVTNVSVTPVFDTNTQQSVLDVAWTPSTSNDVQTYTVRYSQTGTDGWSYAHVNGDTSSVRINNVMSGQTYYVGVQSIDFVANESAFVSAGTYPVIAARDTAAPSVPEKPTVVSSAQRIQVTITGKTETGSNMESDVSYYEVYYSPTSTFTPSNSTMIGQIAAGPAMIQTFNIPASNTTKGATSASGFVKVIAVDRATNKSGPSAAATAAPGLIDGAFIVDASIDNAKIRDLRADQLIAGSGLITDLSVLSALTIGGQSSNGVIQSYGYLPGVSGYHMEKDTLEINNGSIAAGALRIQNSQNIMLPQYADFEFAERYYVLDKTISGSAFAGINSDARYVRSGTQSLIATAAGSVSSQIYLSSALNDYNHSVQELTTYIFSAWVLRTDSGTFNLALQVRQDSGVVITAGSSLALTTGKWTRVSGTFTTGAGVSEIVPVIILGTGTAGTVYVDQVQLEEKIGAINTPSTWKPPSHTSIDGGSIRTGEMRSTTLVDVNGTDQPAWSLNVQGNMQVGDAQIRGRLIVGDSEDSDNDASYIASGNYAQGQSGYKIGSSGSPEFNDGTFRGTIMATAGSFGDMQVTGLLTTDLTQTTNRTEFDVDGIRLISVDTTDPTLQNTVINFPNDPDQDSMFQGNVIANSLTIQDQMAVRGKSNEFSRNSQTVLRTSVSAPGTPPAVIVDWQSASFAKGAQYTGLYYDSTTGDYNFLGHYQISGATPARTILYAMKPNESAPRVIGTFNTSSAPYGLVKLSNRWWTLEYKPKGTTAAAWYVVCYDTAFSKIGETLITTFGTSQAPLPTIGADFGGNQILLAYNKSNATTIWRENINTTTGTISFVESYTMPQTIGSNSNLTWVGYGAFDFGSNRYVIAARANGDTGKVFTYTRSGTVLTNLPDETFQIANKISATGFGWNGTVFVSHAATTGAFNYYTQNKWTTEPSRWWCCYTWRQTTNGYETTRGTVMFFTMTKRARITLTAAPIPNSGDVATDPNAVSFYVNRGIATPTTFVRQTNPAVGARTISYTNVAFSGTNSPATNTFPATTPGVIQSENAYANGNKLLKLQGDGNAWVGTLSLGDTSDVYQGSVNWYTKNAISLDAFQMRQYLYQGGAGDSGMAIVLMKNGTEASRLEMGIDGLLYRTVGGVKSSALFETDSGWNNFPATSGFTGTRYKRKKNGIMYVSFAFSRDTGQATYSGDLSVLPFSTDELPAINTYPGPLMVYNPTTGVTSPARTFLDITAKALIIQGLTVPAGGSVTGKLDWPL